MAKNAKISTGLANAFFDSDITNDFDGGTLDIYDGTQPANADAAEGSVNLLASIPLPTPAFAAAAAAGVLAKAGTWEDTSANLNGAAA